MNTANTTIAILALVVVASFIFRTSLAFRLMVSGIFVFVLLLIFYPGIAAFMTFLAAGVWVLYSGIVGLKNGSIVISAMSRFMFYSRENNPIEYWFYVFFGIVGGVCMCAVALYIAFHFPIFRFSHDIITA